MLITRIFDTVGFLFFAVFLDFALSLESSWTLLFFAVELGFSFRPLVHISCSGYLTSVVELLHILFLGHFLTSHQGHISITPPTFSFDGLYSLHFSAFFVTSSITKYSPSPGLFCLVQRKRSLFL